MKIIKEVVKIENNNGDYYELDDDEKKEIENILNQHKEMSYEGYNFKEPGTKNRLTYTYNSESHWAGWLRIHGIKW